VYVARLIPGINKEVHQAVVRKRRRSATVLAVLTAALIALLAIPAFASALATYKVENNGDGSTKALCEAHITNECTLRGALEAAEADPGFDIIEFAIAVFNGQVGEDEIAVGATPLPTITQPLLMAGHPCEYPLLGYSAPCVGVTAHTGEAALKVESSGVSIEEVAFGGGKYGIEVVAPSTAFSARSDWFGMKLDGTANAISEVGIRIGPGADEATIGGAQPSERNVFTHSAAGLEIESGSDAQILGNYFGVDPQGKGPPTLGNGIGIFEGAEHNEIGGVLTSAEAATPVCDGACNVIATETGAGIYISGRADETAEPTTVRGNLLGLEADGVTPIGPEGNFYGVVVQSTAPCGAGPSNVTVGGTAPTEANFIVGGNLGIYTEGAENFTAAGNAIGIDAEGEPSESPEGAGIAVCASGVTRTGHVIGNRMDLGPDAIGIESSWGRAEILGNSINGSYKGILLNAESEGHGDVVTGNTITAPDTVGIEVENDSNVVAGNTITKAGNNGIVIVTDADHNRIGGDAAGEANTIVETAGSAPEDGAITMFGRESGRNEFAANLGIANPGAFIKLLPHGGQERPNGGIQPPAFASVEQSSASGTADANATVRIFSKASAEAGELGALLAVVTADATGAWKATYGTVPVGTLIAATQTSNAGTAEAGTSVVGAPSAATADTKVTEPEHATPGPAPANPNPPKPKPKVKILSGPKKSATSTTAKFKFKAEPSAEAKFECKLDRSKWAKCKSPKTYKKLKPGKHTFQVRAVANGAAAKFKFTVKT
jgi:copper-binding protein NosD